MPTILDTLKKGTEYLEKYGVEEARLSMEHLLAHVLKMERMQLYLDFDRPIEEDSLVALRELTKRRSRGEPLQHLLGVIEFSGLEFLTDARALIPRPETEELVALLLERLEKNEKGGLRLLDVGCGSGVIGLSLSHHLGDRAVEVVLADLSEEALSLARENADRLGLGERVQWVTSDLLAEVSGTFDLIIANLPYVPDREQTELSREVQRDPPLALYGGEKGTEVIERLLEQSPSSLVEGGVLALEHGIDQSEPLRVLAEDLGYDPVETVRDLSGVDRFLFATKSA